MLKKLDSEELGGFLKSVNTQAGVYTVLWGDDREEFLTVFPSKHLIVDSPDTSMSKWARHCMKQRLNPLY